MAQAASATFLARHASELKSDESAALAPSTHRRLPLCVKRNQAVYP